MDRDFHIQVQLDGERVFHHQRGRAPQDREGCLVLHKCPGSECGGEQASPWRQGGITGKSGQGRHLAIVLFWLGKFLERGQKCGGAGKKENSLCCQG